MTNWVIMWEDPDGIRKWEALEESQLEDFLIYLVCGEHVNSATIMVSCNPIFFHWFDKNCHDGLSDVHFAHINEEIYGVEPCEHNHKPVDIPISKPKEKPKYGWLSPDGRFFNCDYGGHSNLADKIVGEIQHVFNPERHLEDLGWAKIMHGIASAGKQYSIGMGLDKKLTDEQLKTLQREKLDDAWGIEFLL